MPIEIKELHIKINVDEKAAATATSSIDEAKIMKAINESVEQMANIGKRKKER